MLPHWIGPALSKPSASNASQIFGGSATMPMCMNKSMHMAASSAAYCSCSADRGLCCQSDVCSALFTGLPIRHMAMSDNSMVLAVWENFAYTLGDSIWSTSRRSASTLQNGQLLLYTCCGVVMAHQHISKPVLYKQQANYLRSNMLGRSCTAVRAGHAACSLFRSFSSPRPHMPGLAA